jgi:hypothetical protein
MFFPDAHFNIWKRIRSRGHRCDEEADGRSNGRNGIDENRESQSGFSKR